MENQLSIKIKVPSFFTSFFCKDDMFFAKKVKVFSVFGIKKDKKIASLTRETNCLVYNTVNLSMIIMVIIVARVVPCKGDNECQISVRIGKNIHPG